MDGTAATSPAGKGGEKRKQAVVWTVAVSVMVICAIGEISGGGDSDTSVPGPAAQERSGTVPLLKAAADSQGICYGWELLDVYDDVSVGSNLGDGVRAAEAPGCARWIEVSANIKYTSATSDFKDSATIRVKGSDDIGYADLSAIESGLAHFGLDEDAFVDDPGWAVTRAATILPLLAVERGLAGAAAPPTPGPSTPAAALPDAGNDLLRDRWVLLLVAAGLLLFAALFIAVGVRRRRAATPAGPAWPKHGTALIPENTMRLEIAPARRTRSRP
ncbi:hypothetical protein [Micromonospora sp. DT31]|uniref:hypothetical protein n=1 Tax=Micromonospora sp. DT31 TaxID=3393434 RepID=UPI003CF28B96